MTFYNQLLLKLLMDAREPFATGDAGPAGRLVEARRGISGGLCDGRTEVGPLGARPRGPAVFPAGAGGEGPVGGPTSNLLSPNNPIGHRLQTSNRDLHPLK